MSKDSLLGVGCLAGFFALVLAELLPLPGWPCCPPRPELPGWPCCAPRPFLPDLACCPPRPRLPFGLLGVADGLTTRPLQKKRRKEFKVNLT